MAYQPTYPSPYMETIDATQEGGNIFKCLVNPKDTVLDAVINIYNNDTPAECLVYTGGTANSPSSNNDGERILTYITATIEEYSQIEQRRRRGEILSIKIVWGSQSRIRTISQIIYPLDNTSSVYIYLDSPVVVGATTYNWFVYSNIVIGDANFPQDTFPFKGGLSDNSWLTCKANTAKLINGGDYKWNIYLKTAEDMVLAKSLQAITPPQSMTGANLEFKEYIYCSFTDKKDLLARCLYAINQDACYIIINSKRIRIIDIYKYRADVSVDNELFTDVTYLKLETPLPAAYSHKDTFSISQSFNELVSCEYYFKARTAPEITFQVPEVINSSSYTFSATYSQEQMVGITYFQYDILKNGVEIASSGKVFTQDITYTFNNLVSDAEYDVVLTIVNNDGVELRKERSFVVEYPPTSSVIAPVLSLNDKTGCISVNFDNNASIPATVAGGDTVDYKSFGIANQPSNYSVISSGKILEGSVADKLFIDYHHNVKADMYISVNDEIVRISHCKSLDDTTIELQVKPSLQAKDIEGLPYEILSFFNGIHLEDNQSILWDTISGKPLALPDDSSQVIHWHGNHGFTGTIVEKINTEFYLGSTVVNYDGMNFTYKIGTNEEEIVCPYIGIASAIAGRDEHSAVSHIVAFDPSSPLSFRIDKLALDGKALSKTDGLSVQINNESRIVTSIENDGNNLIVTIDRAFSSAITTETPCVIYDETYLFVLSDTDSLLKEDILIDNDLCHKYWWLIALLPDEVRFEKTVPFLEVTQNINLTESEV